MLRPLAAIGDRSSSGREFVPSAIDEPRAGRVHALKSSEIEDHAFCVFSGGKERSPGRLELVSGGDDPLPSQRQHDPVRAVLSSYGRRRAHQALRPSRNGAHIAPPGDCRAKTTSSPTHTGIRATTNQVQIGDPVTQTQNSRTKRVNFCPGQRTGLQDCRVVLEPFLSRPPPGAQSMSESVSCRIASAPAARLCRSGHPASSLVAEALPPPKALCSDPGRGRRDRAQMEPESATRLVARFAALKAIHIRGAAAPSSRHGAQCVNSAVRLRS